MVRIELKKDWKRKGLKTIPAGTIIAIDEALQEKLERKGLFKEAKKEEVKNKEAKKEN